MAVQDFMKSGLGPKQRVRIITVDPLTRRIEANLKDGSMIQIVLWDTPILFRWPQEGEIWTVRKDGGYWFLDTHHPVTGNFQIESMNAGDAQIDTATGRLFINDATAITDQNSNQILPPGSTMGWLGTGDPPGGLWFRCNGRTLSRTEYVDLFSVIGITQGSGDGSTTFNIATIANTIIKVK